VNGILSVTRQALSQQTPLGAAPPPPPDPALGQPSSCPAAPQTSAPPNSNPNFPQGSRHAWPRTCSLCSFPLYNRRGWQNHPCRTRGALATTPPTPSAATPIAPLPVGPMGRVACSCLQLRQCRGHFHQAPVT
jgi:hypothetical protein